MLVRETEFGTVLAVQNMSTQPIPKGQEIEFNALEGSLSMMSKGACFVSSG